MQYTPNYQLPQYEDNDVTSWLTTYNNSMSSIDTAMHDNATNITKAEANIETLEGQQTQTDTHLSTLDSQVQELQKTTTEHTGQISTFHNDVEQVKTKNSQQDAAIAANKANIGSFYKGTLTHGETTLSIIVGEISEFTLVDVYTSIAGVNPKTITVRDQEMPSSQKLVVMTFDTQESDMTVAVVTREPAYASA